MGWWGMIYRVGFNARLLHSPDLRGWNRYTVNLLGALIALEVEPVLYTDRPLHSSHLAGCLRDASRFASAGDAYSLWEQRWLPRQCGRDCVELLHSPFNFGLPWSSSCPRILTLHDAIGLGPEAGGKPRWSRSGQQGYRINLMLVGQSLLITAVSLVLAWSGWGLPGRRWRRLGKLGFLSGPDVHRVVREPGLTSGGLDRAR